MLWADIPQMETSLTRFRERIALLAIFKKYREAGFLIEPTPMVGCTCLAAPFPPIVRFARPSCNESDCSIPGLKWDSRDPAAMQFKLAARFNLNGAALHAALLFALHGVVGRVLVQFGEARKVEAGIDERLEGRVHLHRQETDVDQLDRLLANHVSADEPHVVCTGEEFQETGVVTDAAAAGIVTVTSPSDHIGNALALRRVFGLAHH